MSFLYLIGLSLAGWVLIIIIHAISKSDEFFKEEMVKDGNNLFATAFTYILFNVGCHFFYYSWVHWVAFILTCVLAAIPFLSALILLISRESTIGAKFTALISTSIPMFLSLNILFTYILKLY